MGIVWLAGCESEPVMRRPAKVAVFDLENRVVNPFQDRKATAVAFFFLRTDCPISNRYAPEIERLASKYAKDGIGFWLVYPEAATSANEIEQHRKEYHMTLPPLRDPRHELVKKAKVTVTPEVAVFLPNGQEIYRGRIDDRYVDFGKERPLPTTRDLDEVLTSLVGGKAIVRPVTRAVGCYIE